MVIQAADARFYITDENNSTLAEINFPTTAPGLITIERTFVDESLRGQGIALQLLTKVVELARREHKKIIPRCPYAEKMLKEHAEFHDVLA